jgi:hypothetical protein
MGEAILVRFPAGADGKDRVAINIGEIASFRSHTVTSYSYQEWTLVTLKSGKEHDLNISMDEFQKRIEDAQRRYHEED